MNNKFSTSPENMTSESSLIAFYQWLLSDDKELSNILSLFEYKNDNLYLKQKEGKDSEETLEMIFNKFQQGRSDDEWKKNIKDVFRQIFFEYYNTIHLIAFDIDITQEINFIKQCLKKLIIKELERQKRDLPCEHIANNVSAITKPDIITKV
ncbi:MAG: hypothetical protein PHQ95_01700 [Candidatus Gracilibacteria bacterium]|nr:hypothetical protein [Candidatus Gracilibacteria bacterium]